MTHKCEYCDSTINPCSKPCHEFNQDKNHVCCSCGTNNLCELPERIVCSKPLCNLKYTVDWYKIKLTEAHDDVARLKALNNQWRLANIGTNAAQKLIENGTLDITGIKLFTSKQRCTWDQIPVETGYILMTLHEEFAKQWAGWLNEKAVKIQIKKELIASTEAKLKKAHSLRELKTSEITKKNEPKVKITLNPYEKIVLHNMKALNLDQPHAEEFTKTMGMNGESRNLKELGLI